MLCILLVPYLVAYLKVKMAFMGEEAKERMRMQLEAKVRDRVQRQHARQHKHNLWASSIGHRANMYGIANREYIDISLFIYIYIY